MSDKCKICECPLIVDTDEEVYDKHCSFVCADCCLKFGITECNKCRTKSYEKELK